MYEEGTAEGYLSLRWRELFSFLIPPGSKNLVLAEPSLRQEAAALLPIRSGKHVLLGIQADGTELTNDP